MGRGALRALRVVIYVTAIVGLFATTSFLAFNQFIRRGVMPVPEVVGMMPDEALVVVRDQGLRLEWAEERERYDESVPAGRILLQAPGSGSLVKRGSALEVVVSKGPQIVEVPSVLGQGFHVARVELAAAGLNLGRTAHIVARGVDPGAVAEQFPPPGSVVDRATPVHLLVALEESAESFLMPDLVYRDYETVRRGFERLGFRVGSVKFELYEGVAEGVVLRQHPLAGHPLRRSGAISLVVASSPAPEGGGL